MVYYKSQIDNTSNGLGFNIFSGNYKNLFVMGGQVGALCFISRQICVIEAAQLWFHNQ